MGHLQGLQAAARDAVAGVELQRQGEVGDGEVRPANSRFGADVSRFGPFLLLWLTRLLLSALAAAIAWPGMGLQR